MTGGGEGGDQRGRGRPVSLRTHGPPSPAPRPGHQPLDRGPLSPREWPEGVMVIRVQETKQARGLLRLGPRGRGGRGDPDPTNKRPRPGGAGHAAHGPQRAVRGSAHSVLAGHETTAAGQRRADHVFGPFHPNIYPSPGPTCRSPRSPGSQDNGPIGHPPLRDCWSACSSPGMPHRGRLKGLQPPPGRGHPGPP